jgi:predicted nucleotidyltransferase
MAMYQTVEMRKRAEAERRVGIPDILHDRLSGFARDHGGRFILYGSLAKGQPRFDSDVDLLLDFPAEVEGEAWRLAEELCAELRVELDIKPLAWCDPEFASKTMPKARIIG